ncbi:MAG TPA: PIN domain-containing protein [Longimicrobium sp.]|nr:PIN domain-containing protein [Longimicrobium sp.]
MLDANVIYPAFLRDVLLRLAASNLYLPYWTARIHDEWIRNVIHNRPDLSPTAFARIRAQMDAHFAGALVTDFEALERQFEGVHENDRHVAAAALKAGANRIVTHNLKDFPAEALQPHGIVASHPDDFICDLIRMDPMTTRGVLEAHRVGLQRPPHDSAEYAVAFVRAGLPKAAALLWP